MTPTILIVDDEPGMQQVMEAILVSGGYHLGFASNGVEALAKAAELTPDLILLDVVMPEMDGLEVCRRLRADPRLAEIPIIIVTANEDPESRLQGLQAGADDFLNKPVDRLEMRARVQTIVRLNRYRRLMAERARFAWVAEHADEGYLTVNDGGAVLYANRAARLFLSLPAEGDIPAPESFVELARKQYRAEPVDAWAGWPIPPDAGDQRPRYLVRPESPTSKAFWLKVDLLDLQAGPDQVWLARLRDVSAEMAAQRGTEQFHRAIVHKLRTPLVGIIGGLELITAHGADLSNAEVVEFSEIALKGAQRLRGEIDDILQYLTASLLARGEGFRLAQLPAVVADIAAGLTLYAVTVTGHESLVDARLGLAEPGVESILWEVLENAKKFHPAHTPAVEVALASSSPDTATLRITDNGLTLSPEQLSKAWAPYYQGEKFFTGEAVGMGLSLSMVASLVWEVGGTCRLYNREPGPGVVVELELPLAK